MHLLHIWNFAQENLVLVIQMLDSTINWIINYAVDKY